MKKILTDQQKIEYIKQNIKGQNGYKKNKARAYYLDLYNEAIKAHNKLSSDYTRENNPVLRDEIANAQMNVTKWIIFIVSLTEYKKVI